MFGHFPCLTTTTTTATNSLLQWFLHQVPARQTLVTSFIQFWTYRSSLHQYPVQVIEQQALSTSTLLLLLSIEWSLAPCTSSRYLNNCYHLLQVSLQHTAATSSRYLYNTPLPPPPGIFTTHSCHLLQVSLQHITATSSRYL